MRKRFRDGKFRRRLAAAASVGCVLTLVSSARAADVTWQGDVSLNWATAGNWDANALPTLADDALIGTGQVITLNSDVGDANNVLLSGDSTVAISASGALNVVTDFSIGSEADSSGAVTQSGGSLSVGEFLRIGDFGEGALTISSGITTVGTEGGAAAVLAGASVDATITVSGGELRQADVDPDNGDSLNYLGLASGGVTTVNLSGGKISMFASTILGQGGASAVVNQTGGVFETRERSVRLGGDGDELNLGEVTYDMTGGSLSTGTFLVVGDGNFSTAELNVSGNSDIQVGRSLLIGTGDADSGAAGVMSMSAGTLAVGVDRDPATPRNTIGDDDVIIGAGPNSSGEFNVSDSAIVDSGAAFFVGGDTFNSGNGVLNQSGGEIVVGTLADPLSEPSTFGDNDFTVGAGTGAVGRYNMSGGSLLAPGFVAIGSDGSVDAVVTVSGVDTFLQLAGEGSAVQVGGQTGMDLDDPNYGQPTDGRLIQNGGTIFVDGQFQIGSGPTAFGKYELNNGALDVVAHTLLSAAPPAEFEPGELSTAESEYHQSGGESVFRSPIQVGDFGKGTINLTGGVMTAADTVGIFLGQNELSAGSQVNFSGGEFNTDGAVLIGFAAAKDVEMNVSGDAVVNVGFIFRLGADVELGSNTFNEGTLNQTGGELNIFGQLQMATGLPDVDPDERSFGFYNMSGGALNIPDTAFLGVDGTGAFRQSGGVVESGNSIVIADAASADFAYELSGGTLDLNRQGLFIGEGNGAFEFTGGRLDGAAFVGFDLTQTGGVLATGGVPNDVNQEMFTQIDGDFNISGDGAIEIHIGGLNPITEHDVMYVVGTATLGGSVNVSFVNGFVPQLDDFFEIVFSESADVVGQFDSLNFPDLPGLDGELVNQGQSTFLVIVEETAGILGDTDDDGDVDITDLNNVRNNFGEDGLGDTDDDGDVDISDLNNVRNNFGAEAPSPTVGEFASTSGVAGYRSEFRDGVDFVRDELNLDGVRSQAWLHGGAGGDPTAVPEPSSCALGLLASLGGLLAFRRRGK